MPEETMLVIGFGNRIPRPVRHLCVDEDDSSSTILGVCVAPHVPLALGIVSGTAGFLEPWVLIGSMVQNHFDDHAKAAFMNDRKEVLEVV